MCALAVRPLDTQEGAPESRAEADGNSLGRETGSHAVDSELYLGLRVPGLPEECG